MNNNLTLQCSSCEHYSNYTISEEMRGLTLQFTCQNTGCKKRIKHSVPKINSDHSNSMTQTSSASSHFIKAVCLKFHNNADLQDIALPLAKSIMGRASKIADKNPDITIGINDPYISRRHCIIECYKNDKGSIVSTIRDNNSSNGTTLNNKYKLKMNEVTFLEDGDIIKIGNTELIFRESY